MPVLAKEPSPVKEKSPTPVREGVVLRVAQAVVEKVPSPEREKSPSAAKDEAVLAKEPSPVKEKSPSPAKEVEASEEEEEEAALLVLAKEPSPVKEKSPTPVREEVVEKVAQAVVEKVPSPEREKSPSPAKDEAVVAKEPSPVKEKSPSPAKEVEPSDEEEEEAALPVVAKEPSPVKEKSPTPVREEVVEKVAQAVVEKVPSPEREKSPSPAKEALVAKEPSPVKEKSPSPAKEVEPSEEEEEEAAVPLVAKEPSPVKEKSPTPVREEVVEKVAQAVVEKVPSAEREKSPSPAKDQAVVAKEPSPVKEKSPSPAKEVEASDEEEEEAAVPVVAKEPSPVKEKSPTPVREEVVEKVAQAVVEKEPSPEREKSPSPAKDEAIVAKEPSPVKEKSPSPAKEVEPSDEEEEEATWPVVAKEPSPVKEKSPTPAREEVIEKVAQAVVEKVPSHEREKSPSPAKEAVLAKEPSPVKEKSPSPAKEVEPSDEEEEEAAVPVVAKEPSPVKEKSPTPAREGVVEKVAQAVVEKVPSPEREKSPSPAKDEAVVGKEPSPVKEKSPSPAKEVEASEVEEEEAVLPVLAKEPSPVKEKSPTPVREGVVLRVAQAVVEKVPSPEREKSPSPAKDEAVLAKEPSPVKEKSPSPAKEVEASEEEEEEAALLVLAKEPSPVKEKSPTPVREDVVEKVAQAVVEKVPSPEREKSPSPAKDEAVLAKEPSPVKEKSPSPAKEVEPSDEEEKEAAVPVVAKEPSPVKEKSPTPAREGVVEKVAQAVVEKVPSPEREKSPSPAKDEAVVAKEPTPVKEKSPSPAKEVEASEEEEEEAAVPVVAKEPSPVKEKSPTPVREEVVEKVAQAVVEKEPSPEREKSPSPAKDEAIVAKEPSPVKEKSPSPAKEVEPSDEEEEEATWPVVAKEPSPVKEKSPTPAREEVIEKVAQAVVEKVPSHEREKSPSPAKEAVLAKEPSPVKEKSPSPAKEVEPSDEEEEEAAVPVVAKEPSPVKEKSPTPAREGVVEKVAQAVVEKVPSPEREKSPSPAKDEAVVGKEPSPVKEKSPSPAKEVEASEVEEEEAVLPVLAKEPSPVKEKSPTPVREGVVLRVAQAVVEKVPSPEREKSPSPAKDEAVLAKEPSPVKEKSPSPAKEVEASEEEEEEAALLVLAKEPSPVKEKSPTPVREEVVEKVAQAVVEKVPSPEREKSPSPAKDEAVLAKEPSPVKEKSPSPAKEVEPSDEEEKEAAVSVVAKEPSPVKEKSPTPAREGVVEKVAQAVVEKVPSPEREKSPSPAKDEAVVAKEPTPVKEKSPSPAKEVEASEEEEEEAALPVLAKEPSPVKEKSPTPVCEEVVEKVAQAVVEKVPSPEREKSPSPAKDEAVLAKEPSPVKEKSPSPAKEVEPSDDEEDEVAWPVVAKEPSPVKEKSPTPVREEVVLRVAQAVVEKVPSPEREKSPSPAKDKAIVAKEPSPVKEKSPSPANEVEPSDEEKEEATWPVVAKEPSPVKEKSPTPAREEVVEKVAQAVVEKVPSPECEKSPSPAKDEAVLAKEPSPVIEKSPSPAKEVEPSDEEEEEVAWPVVDKEPSPVKEKSPTPVCEEVVLQLAQAVVEKVPSPEREKSPSPAKDKAIVAKEPSPVKEKSPSPAKEVEPSEEEEEEAAVPVVAKEPSPVKEKSPTPAREEVVEKVAQAVVEKVPSPEREKSPSPAKEALVAKEPSPVKEKSPSPAKEVEPSEEEEEEAAVPVVAKEPSPVKEKSPTPVREEVVEKVAQAVVEKVPSPEREKSPSPAKDEAVLAKEPSPVKEKSPSPAKEVEPSDDEEEEVAWPVVDKEPSPVKEKSPTPVREEVVLQLAQAVVEKVPSPEREKSPSPAKDKAIVAKEPSPVKEKSPSPAKEVEPSDEEEKEGAVPVVAKEPSPVKEKSPTPAREGVVEKVAQAVVEKVPSPEREKSPSPAKDEAVVAKEPSPVKEKSPSPAKEVEASEEEEEEAALPVLAKEPSPVKEKSPTPVCEEVVEKVAQVVVEKVPSPERDKSPSPAKDEAVLAKEPSPVKEKSPSPAKEVEPSDEEEDEVAVPVVAKEPSPVKEKSPTPVREEVVEKVAQAVVEKVPSPEREKSPSPAKEAVLAKEPSPVKEKSPSPAKEVEASEEEEEEATWPVVAKEPSPVKEKSPTPVREDVVEKVAQAVVEKVPSPEREKSPSPAKEAVLAKEPSPVKEKSPSPAKEVEASEEEEEEAAVPVVAKEPSPVKEKSPTPVREDVVEKVAQAVVEKVPSPEREKSPSPAKDQALVAKEPSPVKEKSPSPAKEVEASDEEEEEAAMPVVAKEPSPVKEKSPTPVREEVVEKVAQTVVEKVPSPEREKSPSPAKDEAVVAKEPSPVKEKSPSPAKEVEPSDEEEEATWPVVAKEPSPVKEKSPTPVREEVVEKVAQAVVEKVPSPEREKSPSPAKEAVLAKEPSSVKEKSPSPAKEVELSDEEEEEAAWHVVAKEPSPVKEKSPTPVCEELLLQIAQAVVEKVPSPEREKSPSPAKGEADAIDNQVPFKEEAGFTHPQSPSTCTALESPRVSTISLSFPDRVHEDSERRKFHKSDMKVLGFSDAENVEHEKSPSPAQEADEFVTNEMYDVFSPSLQPKYSKISFSDEVSYSGKQGRHTSPAEEALPGLEHSKISPSMISSDYIASPADEVSDELERTITSESVPSPAEEICEIPTVEATETPRYDSKCLPHPYVEKQYEKSLEKVETYSEVSQILEHSSITIGEPVEQRLKESPQHYEEDSQYTKSRQSDSPDVVEGFSVDDKEVLYGYEEGEAALEKTEISEGEEVTEYDVDSSVNQTSQELTILEVQRQDDEMASMPTSSIAFKEGSDELAEEKVYRAVDRVVETLQSDGDKISSDPILPRTPLHIDRVEETVTEEWMDEVVIEEHLLHQPRETELKTDLTYDESESFDDGQLRTALSSILEGVPKPAIDEALSEDVGNLSEVTESTVMEAIVMSEKHGDDKQLPEDTAALEVPIPERKPKHRREKLPSPAGEAPEAVLEEKLTEPEFLEPGEVLEIAMGDDSRSQTCEPESDEDMSAASSADTKESELDDDKSDNESERDVESEKSALHAAMAAATLGLQAGAIAFAEESVDEEAVVVAYDIDSESESFEPELKDLKSETEEIHPESEEHMSMSLTESDTVSVSILTEDEPSRAKYHSHSIMAEASQEPETCAKSLSYVGVVSESFTECTDRQKDEEILGTEPVTESYTVCTPDTKPVIDYGDVEKLAESDSAHPDEETSTIDLVMGGGKGTLALLSLEKVSSEVTETVTVSPRDDLVEESRIQEPPLHVSSSPERMDQVRHAVSVERVVEHLPVTSIATIQRQAKETGDVKGDGDTSVEVEISMPPASVCTDVVSDKQTHTPEIEIESIEREETPTDETLDKVGLVVAPPVSPSSPKSPSSGPEDTLSDSSEDEDVVIEYDTETGRKVKAPVISEVPQTQLLSIDEADEPASKSESVSESTQLDVLDPKDDVSEALSQEPESELELEKVPDMKPDDSQLKQSTTEDTNVVLAEHGGNLMSKMDEPVTVTLSKTSQASEELASGDEADVSEIEEQILQDIESDVSERFKPTQTSDPDDEETDELSENDSLEELPLRKEYVSKEFAIPDLPREVDEGERHDESHTPCRRDSLEKSDAESTSGESVQEEAVVPLSAALDHATLVDHSVAHLPQDGLWTSIRQESSGSDKSEPLYTTPSTEKAGERDSSSGEEVNEDIVFPLISDKKRPIEHLLSRLDAPDTGADADVSDEETDRSLIGIKVDDKDEMVTSADSLDKISIVVTPEEPEVKSDLDKPLEQEQHTFLLRLEGDVSSQTQDVMEDSFEDSLSDMPPPEMFESSTSAASVDTYVGSVFSEPEKYRTEAMHESFSGMSGMDDSFTSGTPIDDRDTVPVSEESEEEYTEPIQDMGASYEEEYGEDLEFQEAKEDFDDVIFKEGKSDTVKLAETFDVSSKTDKVDPSVDKSEKKKSAENEKRRDTEKETRIEKKTEESVTLEETYDIITETEAKDFYTQLSDHAAVAAFTTEMSHIKHDTPPEKKDEASGFAASQELKSPEPEKEVFVEKPVKASGPSILTGHVSERKVDEEVDEASQDSDLVEKAEIEDISDVGEMSEEEVDDIPDNDVDRDFLRREEKSVRPTSVSEKKELLGAEGGTFGGKVREELPEKGTIENLETVPKQKEKHKSDTQKSIDKSVVYSAIAATARVSGEVLLKETDSDKAPDFEYPVLEGETESLESIAKEGYDDKEQEPAVHEEKLRSPSSSKEEVSEKSDHETLEDKGIDSFAIQADSADSASEAEPDVQDLVVTHDFKDQDEDKPSRDREADTRTEGPGEDLDAALVSDTGGEPPPSQPGGSPQQPSFLAAAPMMPCEMPSEEDFTEIEAVPSKAEERIMCVEDVSGVKYSDDTPDTSEYVVDFEAKAKTVTLDASQLEEQPKYDVTETQISEIVARKDSTGESTDQSLSMTRSVCETESEVSVIDSQSRGYDVDSRPDDDKIEQIDPTGESDVVVAEAAALSTNDFETRPQPTTSKFISPDYIDVSEVQTAKEAEIIETIEKREATRVEVSPVCYEETTVGISVEHELDTRPTVTIEETTLSSPVTDTKITVEDASVSFHEPLVTMVSSPMEEERSAQRPSQIDVSSGLGCLVTPEISIQAASPMAQSPASDDMCVPKSFPDVMVDEYDMEEAKEEAVIQLEETLASSEDQERAMFARQLSEDKPDRELVKAASTESAQSTISEEALGVHKHLEASSSMEVHRDSQPPSDLDSQNSPQEEYDHRDPWRSMEDADGHGEEEVSEDDRPLSPTEYILEPEADADQEPDGRVGADTSQQIFIEQSIEKQRTPSVSTPPEERPPSPSDFTLVTDEVREVADMYDADKSPGQAQLTPEPRSDVLMQGTANNLT